MKKRPGFHAFFLTLGLSAFLFSCSNREAITQACRNAFDSCMNVSDNNELKVFQNDSSCRASCNEALKQARTQCQLLRDRAQASACLDNANVAYRKSMDSCVANFKAAITEIRNYRMQCVESLANCITGK